MYIYIQSLNHGVHSLLRGRFWQGGRRDQLSVFKGFSQRKYKKKYYVLPGSWRAKQNRICAFSWDSLIEYLH